MDLNKILKNFLIREPFYGLLMLNLNKEVVGPEHAVKTAGIGPKGLNLTLYINKDFWDKLTEPEKYAIIKHEICHLAFCHLTSAFSVPDNKHYQMNVAEDISINQYIKDLPECGWTTAKLEKLLNKPVEKYQGAWYYYKELEGYCKKNEKAFMDMVQEMIDNGEMDDHSLWPKDMDSAAGKLLENHIKNLIKNTADQCKAKGNIPGELKDIIDSIMVKEEIFNWKKYFRRVLGNSIQSFIAPTRYRPSKRFPDAQGLKTKYKPEIFVAVDTSGSISDDEFNDFMSEIYHLYKAGVGVTIAQFDTRIQHIEHYKGNIKKITRYGRGGTDVKEAIEYYKSHRNYSSCIVFTDGYLDLNFGPVQQMVWVITKGGAKQDYPGKVIYIP